MYIFHLSIAFFPKIPYLKPIIGTFCFISGFMAKGVKNSGNGTFSPTAMRDAYREIARLKAAGLRNVEIAEEMNVTSAMVGYVTRSGMVKEQIEKLHQMRDADSVDIQKEIQKASAPALAQLLETLLGENGADSKQRDGVARDLLDRAGHGAVRQLEIRRGLFDAERIRAVKEQAVANAKRMGIISEVEVSEAVVLSESVPEEHEDGGLEEE